jgi:hypothetical protein
LETRVESQPANALAAVLAGSLLPSFLVVDSESSSYNLYRIFPSITASPTAFLLQLDSLLSSLSSSPASAEVRLYITYIKRVN